MQTFFGSAKHLILEKHSRCRHAKIAKNCFYFFLGLLGSFEAQLSLSAGFAAIPRSTIPQLDQDLPKNKSSLNPKSMHACMWQKTPVDYACIIILLFHMYDTFRH